jgi:hypothetical protein
MIYIIPIIFQQILAPMSHNVLICLRRFASLDKGFAKHPFRRKGDQGWQNVAEFWRGNGA